jgi:hypothetical protein
LRTGGPTGWRAREAPSEGLTRPCERQRESWVKRLGAIVVQEPCCGGLIVIIPALALFYFVRWVVSTGNLWAISGLIVAGVAVLIAVGLTWRRRARWRRGPL